MKIIIAKPLHFLSSIEYKKGWSCYLRHDTQKHKYGIGIMGFKYIPSKSFLNNKFFWYSYGKEYFFAIRILWFSIQMTYKKEEANE